MIRVVGYVRTSTDEQTAGLDAQVLQLRFAEPSRVARLDPTRRSRETDIGGSAYCRLARSTTMITGSAAVVQESTIRDQVAARGWQLVRIVREQASGAQEDRPGLAEALQLVRGEHADAPAEASAGGRPTCPGCSPPRTQKRRWKRGRQGTFAGTSRGRVGPQCVGRPIRSGGAMSRTNGLSLACGPVSRLCPSSVFGSYIRICRGD